MAARRTPRPARSLTDWLSAAAFLAGWRPLGGRDHTADDPRGFRAATIARPRPRGRRASSELARRHPKLVCGNRACAGRFGSDPRSVGPIDAPLLAHRHDSFGAFQA